VHEGKQGHWKEAGCASNLEKGIWKEGRSVSTRTHPHVARASLVSRAQKEICETLRPREALATFIDCDDVQH
jgi:hypothetical protein